MMEPISKSLSEALAKSGWLIPLTPLLLSDSYLKLRAHLVARFDSSDVYPKPENIFRAFIETPFDSVKVVILGQDPYHGPGEATGLAFGVRTNLPIPPSLRNIFKEIERDYGEKVVGSSDLTGWASQGVLLLNSVLTVEKGQPGSHAKMGWEEFTDGVIKVLADRQNDTAFMFWGKYAEAKAKLLPRNGVKAFITTHPSPFSAHKGFLGSGCFRDVNLYLESKGKTPIDWLQVDSKPSSEFGKLLEAMGLIR